jgi:hypothetical protein
MLAYLQVEEQNIEESRNQSSRDSGLKMSLKPVPRSPPLYREPSLSVPQYLQPWSVPKAQSASTPMKVAGETMEYASSRFLGGWCLSECSSCRCTDLDRQVKLSDRQAVLPIEHAEDWFLGQAGASDGHTGTRLGISDGAGKFVDRYGIGSPKDRVIISSHAPSQSAGNR